MRILERLDAKRLQWRAQLEEEIGKTSPLAHALELDRRKEFDQALHRRLSELGVFGVGTRKEDGGSGGDAVDQVVALEVIGRLATSMAVVCIVNFLNTRLLRQYGDAAQKAEYLKPLLRGEKQGSFCLTEIGGGTDVLGSIRTRAERTSDGWVLNGDKTWVSGASTCDVMLVVARTAEHRTRGLTTFVVPASAPGIHVQRLGTMALNGYPSCEVRFDQVLVPAEAVLGDENAALAQLMSALNGERICAAATVNGVARGALEAGLDRAKGRIAFGKPIGQFQAVQHRLAAVAVQTELAWMSVVQAAERDALGEATDILGSLAKWSSSKAALAATDCGMEMMAASGFLEQGVMQRYFRDARLHVFAPINNDMILNLLGERWLGLPRSF
jgi:acyl-CoA dehydrogenase